MPRWASPGGDLPISSWSGNGCKLGNGAACSPRRTRPGLWSLQARGVRAEVLVRFARKASGLMLKWLEP